MLSVVAITFTMFAASVLQFRHTLAKKGKNFIEKSDSLSLRLRRRWQKTYLRPRHLYHHPPTTKFCAQTSLFKRAQIYSWHCILLWFHSVECIFFLSFGKDDFWLFHWVFCAVFPFHWHHSDDCDLVFSSCCCDTCALCVFWICARNRNTNELYKKKCRKCEQNEMSKRNEVKCCILFICEVSGWICVRRATCASVCVCAAALVRLYPVAEQYKLRHSEMVAHVTENVIFRTETLLLGSKRSHCVAQHAVHSVTCE